MKISNISVGIIGGGPNGIIALYECLKVLDNVTLYEKSDSYGGVWNLSSGNSQAHFSTIFNTSSPISSWDIKDTIESRFQKDFITSTEYYAYLQSVVKEYNLMPYIKFNLCITDISRSGGIFILHSDKNEEYIHDYVIVATSRFGNEIIPQEISHLVDQYTHGPFWHSRHWNLFQENHPSAKVLEKENLTILVLGGGHSGSEAIQDTIEKFNLENKCKNRRLKIYWSLTRHLDSISSWLIDRYPYEGSSYKNLPADQDNCRLYSALPDSIMGRIIAKLATPLHIAKENTFRMGLDNICIAKTKVIKPALKDGTVEVLHSNIQIIKNEQTGQLSFFIDNETDGNDTQNVKINAIIDVDAVVLATGYEFCEPNVNGKKLVAKGALYRKIIPVDEEFNQKLAYLCVTRYFGSVFSATQLEIRWILYHWLWDKTDKLKNEVAQYQKKLTNISEEELNLGGKLIRNPSAVMDELAGDIPGAMPRIWRNLLHPNSAHRHLGLACLLTPATINHYRICRGGVIGENEEQKKEQAIRDAFTLNFATSSFRKSGCPIGFRTLCLIYDLFYYSTCFFIILSGGRTVIQMLNNV